MNNNVPLFFNLPITPARKRMMNARICPQFDVAEWVCENTECCETIQFTNDDFALFPIILFESSPEEFLAEELGFLPEGAGYKPRIVDNALFEYLMEFDGENYPQQEYVKRWNSCGRMLYYIFVRDLTSEEICKISKIIARKGRRRYDNL